MSAPGSRVIAGASRWLAARAGAAASTRAAIRLDFESIFGPPVVGCTRDYERDREVGCSLPGAALVPGADGHGEEGEEEAEGEARREALGVGVPDRAVEGRDRRDDGKVEAVVEDAQDEARERE